MVYGIKVPTCHIRIRVTNSSIWASCNVLNKKLGLAATTSLILCSVQQMHQRLVLCAISSHGDDRKNENGHPKPAQPASLKDVSSDSSARRDTAHGRKDKESTNHEEESNGWKSDCARKQKQTAEN